MNAANYLKALAIAAAGTTALLFGYELCAGLAYGWLAFWAVANVRIHLDI